MTSEFPTKLNMPLFMITRNRIKYHGYDQYQNYMFKHRKFYAGREVTDDEIQCIKEQQHEKQIKKCPRIMVWTTRDRTSYRPWHLSPNRYDLPKLKSPYAMKGAFWSRLKLPSAQSKMMEEFKFYDIPRDIERLQKHCLIHTGKFVTDPRNRRPSSRFMVTDTATCFRYPNDPGPAHYYPKNYTISAWLSKVRYKIPIIYKFLPNSCVPAKEMSIHAHISPATPGPGRYESFEIACPCSSRFLYDPRIFIEYEIQKMRKFRRLSYKKIPFNRFCGPTSSRNIFGHGHTYLFRKIFPQVDEKEQALKPVKPDKDAAEKFYNQTKYLAMIIAPNRRLISSLNEPLPVRPIKIRYDRLAKLITRRQLRDNKKIAFLSGCPRFKDQEAPMKLKTFQPINLNQPLPNLTRIKNRLQHIPKRFLCTYTDVHIKPFQFSPLPPLKTLIRQNEVRITVDDRVKYYQKTLKPEEFFKQEFLTST